MNSIFTITGMSKERYNKQLQNSGFAIVVALALMSFVLLLLLSITTFVRVESQATTTQKLQLQARQSALLGLQIAVGELQTLTGPDLRITATAELAENPVNVRNPHWTGAWRAAGTVSTVPGASVPSKQLLSWLVSGNEATAFPIGTANATPSFEPDDELSRNIPQLNPSPGDNVVTLLGESSVNLSTADLDGDSFEDGGGVVAPLVEVFGGANQVTSRYAYWVGDEGVKARINLNDPNLTADPATEEGRSRLAVPSRSAAELFSAESDPDPDLWGTLYAANDPLNERVQGINDFVHALNTDTISAASLLQTNFHDLSVSSESLFVDSKNGGLKYDLTTATRFTGGAWDGFKNAVSTGSAGQIFPPMTSAAASNRDPGGPRWDVLQSFVQSGVDSTGITPQEHDLDTHGFAPVIQEFKMMGGPSIIGTGSGRSIRMHFMPVLTLWNPYDHPLKAQDYYVVFGPTDSKIRVHVGLNNEHWAANGDSSASDRDTQLDFRRSDRKNSSELDPDRDYRFLIRSPVIPPGRALVFTPPAGGQLMTFYSTAPSDSSAFNVLEPGYRLGANYYADFPPLSPALEDDDEIYHLTLEGSAGENTDLWMGLSVDGVRDSPVFVVSRSYMFSLDIHYRKNSTYPRVTLSGDPLVSEDLIDNTDGTYIAEEPIFAYWMQLRMFEDMLDRTYNKTIPFLRSYNPRGPLHAQSQIEDRTVESDRSFRTIPTFWRGLIYQDEDGVFYNLNNVINDLYIAPGFSPYTLYGETFIAFRAFQRDTDFYSIGDLMHANLIPDHGDVEINIAHKQAGANYPAYSIGSSAQSPYIAANSTLPYRNQWPSGSRDVYSGGTDNTFYDLPFLLNDALWDRFYFSAIDDTTSVSLNSRYQEQDSGLFAYDAADAQSFSAGHSILGGFNVNSTSVDAWAAVLGAYLGVQSEINSSVAVNESLLDRVALPGGASFKAGDNADSEEAWSGSRMLSSAEIRSLAIAIVQEVKSRGPFLSLSDFVNRDLTDPSAGEARKRGALDAAIKASGVNTSLAASIGSEVLQWNESDFPSPGSQNGFGLHNLEALTEPLSDQIPGALSQPDLLAKFGSVLTARSDTFTVRFYGDAIDPITGVAQARAWGEAVAQRTIEPVDPSSQDIREPSVGTVDTLGRRYRIKSIRWLNSDEV